MRLSQVFLWSSALLVQASLLQLSHWQWGRYHQRLAQQAEFATRTPSTYSGTFINAQTVVLDNQPNPRNEDLIGWRVLTPFQTTSQTLIVDRGWAPANSLEAPDLTVFETSATIVQGIPQPFPARRGWLQGPDITINPKRLAFLNPTLLTSATTPAFYLLSTGATPGITAASPPALPDPYRHLSYAIQWLAMAAGFPVMCLLAYLKSKKAKPKGRR